MEGCKQCSFMDCVILMVAFNVCLFIMMKIVVQVIPIALHVVLCELKPFRCLGMALHVNDHHHLYMPGNT